MSETTAGVASAPAAQATTAPKPNGATEAPTAPPPSPRASSGAAPAEAAQNAKAIEAAVDKATGGEQDLFDLETHGDRVVELMVNGERVRMPLREAMRDVMRSKAAYKKMAEAAETSKKAQALIEAIKRDAGAAAVQLGPDAVQQTIKRLVRLADDPSSPPWVRPAVIKAFEEMQAEDAKPPEQRQKETLDERERRVKEREEAFAAAEREAQEIKQAKVIRKQLVKDFQGALTKAGVDVTPESMDAMVDRARELLGYGLSLSDPNVLQECAELVREAEDARVGKAKSRLATLPPEKLAAELGEDKLRELREWDLARVRGAAPKPREAPPPPQEAGPGWIDADEARARIKARRGGR